MSHQETSRQNWVKIGILLLHSLTHFDDIQYMALPSVGSGRHKNYIFGSVLEIIR